MDVGKILQLERAMDQPILEQEILDSLDCLFSTLLKPNRVVYIE